MRAIVALRRIAALAVLVASAAAARADVVVIVSADSPIPALTEAEIADIFLGRMTKLPDGTRPVPLDRPESSPLRDELYQKVAHLSAVQLKAYWSKLIFTGRGRPPRALGSDEAVLRAVRQNPAAIGYVDRRVADDTVRIVSE